MDKQSIDSFKKKSDMVPTVLPDYLCGSDMPAVSVGSEYQVSAKETIVELLVIDAWAGAVQIKMETGRFGICFCEE